MVNAGTNHLGIDRSKTVGGRRRQMATDHKKKLRQANKYEVSATRYGLYRDGNEWQLTGLKMKRSEQRLVSDRRGGTTSEVVDEKEIRPTSATFGFPLETFETKTAATEEYYTPDSWKRVNAGVYWGEGSYNLYKVDRDEWRDWMTQV